MILDFGNVGAAIPCFKLVCLMAPLGIVIWILLSSIIEIISSSAYTTRLKIEQMYSTKNSTS